MNETTNKPAYGKISMLAWAHFLNDGASNYLPGVLPAIVLGLGGSVSLAGVLMASLLIGQTLQPLMGLASDRFGGRAFTLLGLAGSSLAGGLIAFAPNAFLLVLILLLLGVANAAFHPQSLAAVRALSRNRQGTAMSIFLIGGEIGRGLWPFLVSLMVMHAGLKSLWVLAIPGFLTLAFLRNASIKLPPHQRGAAKVNWGTHFKPLSILVMFSGLRGVMLYAISTFVPMIWQQRGGSLAGGAAFIMVMMLVGIVGNFLGGRLGDIYDKRRIIGIGMVGAIAAMIAYMLTGGVWLWIFIALVGIGLFVTFPLTILIGQDITPENRSFGSGMALGLSNGLGALGVLALAPMADAWGTPAALWASIGCGILSLPFVWGLAR